jgi:hypothetical protein
VSHGAIKAAPRLIGFAPLTFSRAAAFTYAGRAQGIVRGAQEGSHEGNRIAGPVDWSSFRGDA